MSTPGRCMHVLMKRCPRLRYRVWRFTTWYQYRPSTRNLRRAPLLWRPVHWLWCYSAPLGSCNKCHEPTWNPVTFTFKLEIGRSGHYYCERCGPAIVAAALAVAEDRVELPR
jgi:hypothetical protein